MIRFKYIDYIENKIVQHRLNKGNPVIRCGNHQELVKSNKQCSPDEKILGK